MLATLHERDRRDRQGSGGPTIEDAGRRLGEVLAFVYGPGSQVEGRQLGSGKQVLVACDWLEIYPSGVGRRWIVRARYPEGPRGEWFERLPCYRGRNGQPTDCPSFEDATLRLLELEAHRRGHIALEGGR